MGLPTVVTRHFPATVASSSAQYKRSDFKPLRLDNCHRRHSPRTPGGGKRRSECAGLFPQSTSLLTIPPQEFVTRTGTRPQYFRPPCNPTPLVADGGGSNGCRPRLWKARLQTQVADGLGLAVTVCHYPTGASHYNPIEHRLFGPISINWAGKPQRSLPLLLACIRGTRRPACRSKPASTGSSTKPKSK